MGLFSKLFGHAVKKGGKVKTRSGETRKATAEEAAGVGSLLGSNPTLRTAERVAPLLGYAGLAAGGAAGLGALGGAGGLTGGGAGGTLGKIGGAIKGLDVGDLAELGLTGAGLIAGAKAGQKAGGIREAALAELQAERAARAPLRQQFIAGLGALPSQREDLSGIFASASPFSRVGQMATPNPDALPQEVPSTPGPPAPGPSLVNPNPRSPFGRMVALRGQNPLRSGGRAPLGRAVI